jgi:hypothetical protein
MLLLLNVRWPRLRLSRMEPWVWRIPLGAAIVAPFALLITALLASADPVFARVMPRLDLNLFNFEWLGRLGEHFFVALLVAWPVGGLLAHLVRAVDQVAEGDFGSRAFLGIVEVAVALGLLDLILAVFGLVQIQYFFRGVDPRSAGVDMTYAEYARQGFFQLLGVSSVSLVTLLWADWATRRQDRRSDRIFVGLAITMVGFIGVVIVSAMARMNLYVAEYGLTQLRLYSTATMIWLGLLFGWFAVALVAGARQRFAFGVMVTGLVTLAALTLVNPDAQIARTNLEAERSGPVDVGYLRTLSADAVPTLVGLLDRIPPTDRPALARQLLYEWGSSSDDWRAWNLGRQQARASVASRRAELEVLASL